MAIYMSFFSILVMALLEQMGTELKSLLASGLLSDKLDYEAIDAYLTLGFFPTPRSPLAQVRKLGPGELLLAGPEGVRRERYWHYPLPAPEQPPRSEREYAEELLAELEESVRLRLMSDRKRCNKNDKCYPQEF